ncbi:MAG TPA: uroporphyrinogen decarboxylase family protein [Candidatus Sulfotelmatobacter sp.]|nr:uroporphyrinogen decarboxylase family protein [Candidatus Sulfotelmatobacter sp.]HWI59793.1 uroporphyrinogen decarboxylase family protein [Bacillota bacterium]
MTEKQWNELLGVIEGKAPARPPIAFIIDCPWLPNWYGVSILDYFTNEGVWFEANCKAIKTFPEITFLPGFWSEFGMCTEPSAFGAKCIFHENEFPFAEKVIRDVAQIDELAEPNPKTDGLLPFMLNRLKIARPSIEDLGHQIRFSVSRGPLNVASFLMGTTEFMMALKTDPDKAHKLLRIITDFLKKWHELQRETIPTIDGIFMLDDIVGFIGEEDFKEFGLPYFKELYASDVRVKFFHNDAECAKSIKYYPEIGINLYNPGIFNTLTQLRQMCGNRLTILGNIPPRDVLAKGSPADVSAAVTKLLAEATDPSRLLLSCAGGMPPGVKTENISAFIEAARA